MIEARWYIRRCRPCGGCHIGDNKVGKESPGGRGSGAQGVRREATFGKDIIGLKSPF
jgi:hypothetical protein